MAEIIFNEPTIMQSIIYEVEYFKANHNGASPEKIFISYPLHDKIIAHYRHFANRKEVICLCGIPVQPYECEKEDFYLAERKGNLRRLSDDLARIYRKEDDIE